jgi:predicted nucleic acid-binding Zn ribbon protein
MSRRPAPRPAAGALRAALERAAPRTRLAAVQASWEEAVGPRVAAVARPVGERGGTVTVSCDDPVWAEELELMQEGVLDALKQRLGKDAPRSLRFRAEDVEA